MKMIASVFFFVTLALAQVENVQQQLQVPQVQENEEQQQMGVEAFRILGGKFEGAWNRIATPWVSSLAHYNGYVYGIGRNKWIWRVSENGGNWHRLANSCCVLQIYVAGGQIWGIGTDNAVWKRPINGSWRRITTPWVKQITRHKNYVYGIGRHNHIWRTGLNGGPWRRIAESCCVTNMVLNGGYIYGVGTDKALWKRPIYSHLSNAWKRIAPCCVTQIQIYKNYVFGIGTNKHVYVTHKIHPHNTWRILLSSCCVKHITVGGGKLFGIGLAHALWSKRSLPPAYVAHEQGYGSLSVVAAVVGLGLIGFGGYKLFRTNSDSEYEALEALTEDEI